MVKISTEKLRKLLPDFRLLEGITVFGIRFDGAREDYFDDLLGFVWKGQTWACKGTTRPGLYWLKNPMRDTGCARLKPGYYQSCWLKGLHKGRPGLVQSEKANFIVQRDNNLDEKFDESSPEYKDTQGLNMHRAGPNTQRVWKWSAGCQVTQREDDFIFIWDYVKLDTYKYVSYQLFDHQGTADEFIASTVD